MVLVGYSYFTHSCYRDNALLHIHLLLLYYTVSVKEVVVSSTESAPSITPTPVTSITTSGELPTAAVTCDGDMYCFR